MTNSRCCGIVVDRQRLRAPRKLEPLGRSRQVANFRGWLPLAIAAVATPVLAQTVPPAQTREPAAATSQKSVNAIPGSQPSNDDYGDMVSRARHRQLSAERNTSTWDRSVQAHHDACELLDGEFRLAGLVVGPESPVQRLTDPHQWHWLGPKNLGGRTRALLIDPRNPSKMWVGSVSGGLWSSDNGGDSWQLDPGLIAGLPVSCLSMDKDSGNLYAGTGELVGSDRDPDLGNTLGKRLGIQGTGIFRQAPSRWERVPGTGDEKFEFVNRLAFAWLDTTPVLLAATHRGLFQIVHPQSPTPVVSSVNLGHEGPIADVEFHPTNPQEAVAGGFEETADGHSEAYYTDDAGMSWKQAEHTGWIWKDRVELAYAHADPKIVYCSANAWREGDDDETSRSRIFISTDGGRAYTVRPTRLKQNDGNTDPVDYLGKRGDYANTLWASDPRDARLLVAGNQNLYRSEDGGDSLTQISEDPGSTKIATLTDFHIILLRPNPNPSGPISVYCGCDGGVWLADDIRKVDRNLDGPQAWKPRNTGYGTIQFYGAAGNARTGTILGGAQDLGVVTRPLSWSAAADPWSLVSDGDGGLCAAVQQDPMLDRFYFCLDGLSPYRAVLADHQTSKTKLSSDDPIEKTSNFIVPLLLDPNRGERLLLGGASLWQTNNARATASAQDPRTRPRWNSIKDPLIDSTDGKTVINISTIAISRHDSDPLWVGHNNGRIFRTSDGTKDKPAWREEIIADAVTDRYCTRIEFDPRKPEEVYVLFGGYHSDNLWVRRKGTTAWVNLPIVPPASLQPAEGQRQVEPLQTPLRSLSFHPDRNEFLYLGTEVGLYCSDDSGKSWMPVNEGPAHVPVEGLFWMSKTLVAVTHGRRTLQCRSCPASQ